MLLTNTPSPKELASVYEIHVTGAISKGQQGEGLHSEDMQSFKGLKDKSWFFLYFRFSENRSELWYKPMLPEGNSECDFETLYITWKFGIGA